MDDKKLLAELRNNNITAFEQFFRENQPNMVIYASNLLDDWEMARDIVQEVFVSFWENKSTLEIRSSLKSYLYSAIKHQCINVFKHKMVEENYNDKIILEFRQLQFSHYQYEEPHLRLHEKELGRKIEQVISGLPDQCRVTFELSRYRGMKSREIAHKLDISVRTVETQIYRALQTLKKSLKDYLYFF
jgi:RNA polymerase sigma-70 factor (ECF subfamily)